MKSTAHIQGHPIHPMLIPYPFALLSSAALFDVGSRLCGRAGWSHTARHLMNAGIGSALVAAVPGVVDYFGTLRPGTTARRTATKHALFNLSALACFALAGARRKRDGRLPPAGLMFALVGTGLLSAGGWLGGELVYHQRVAVVDEDSSQAVAVP
jgi:uncharacterized membrane protein